MSRKSVLGRGLASLIPEAAMSGSLETSSGQLLEVDIDLIDANQVQPRSHFNQDRLAELSESIREQGILQPLVVTSSTPGRYELIAGERRLRASKLAGLLKVPVILREVGDAHRLELALIENVQRDDLNPIELAVAYLRLKEQFGHSHEKIAQKVGKDRSSVTNHLRLLGLPSLVQQAIINEELTMGHARCLAGLKTEAEIASAFKIVMTKGLSVRQTEQLVRSAKSEPGKSAGTTGGLSPADAQWSEATRRLERNYSTKVRLVKKGTGGSIQLSFSTKDELNRILDRLLSA